MREIGFAERGRFRRDRESVEFQQAYTNDSPLVTVCIATYNRGELLVERSLRSILAQDYPNLQVVVVGDHCTDDTCERMSRVTDPRVVFVNLTERGNYPTDPYHRWMVAGTAAVNHALSLARGEFVTHLDDDDEHPPERVSTLLAYIRQQKADLVWHPFEFELPNGDWEINLAPKYAFRSVTTSSVFYHRRLAEIRWDAEAWRNMEPGDWNRFRKLRFLGIRAVRHPGVLLKHYREKNQRSS